MVVRYEATALQFSLGGGLKGCPPPHPSQSPSSMSSVHPQTGLPALGGGGMMVVRHEDTALPFKVGGGLKGCPPHPPYPLPNEDTALPFKVGGSQGLPPPSPLPPPNVPSSPACMASSIGGGVGGSLGGDGPSIRFGGGFQGLPPPPPIHPPQFTCMHGALHWGGGMMAVHHEDTDLPFSLGGSQGLPPPPLIPIPLPNEDTDLPFKVGGGPQGLPPPCPSPFPPCFLPNVPNAPACMAPCTGGGWWFAMRIRPFQSGWGGVSRASPPPIHPPPPSSPPPQCPQFTCMHGPLHWWEGVGGSL